MTCPKCQRGISPVDLFCGFCGARAATTRPAPVRAVRTIAEDAGAAAGGLEVALSLPDPASEAPHQRPAGFWIRTGAAAADALLVAAWLGVVWSVVVGASMAPMLGWGDPAMLLATMERTGDLLPAVAALFGGVLVAYLVAFVVLEGATPGKMLFRLVVVRQDGSAPRVGRAFVREVLGRLVGVITVGVGFVLVARADKRGLHDLMGGTQVVRLPQGARTGC